MSTNVNATLDSLMELSQTKADSNAVNTYRENPYPQGRNLVLSAKTTGQTENSKNLDVLRAAEKKAPHASKHFKFSDLVNPVPRWNALTNFVDKNILGESSSAPINASSLPAEKYNNIFDENKDEFSKLWPSIKKVPSEFASDFVNSIVHPVKSVKSRTQALKNTVNNVVNAPPETEDQMVADYASRPSGALMSHFVNAMTLGTNSLWGRLAGDDTWERMLTESQANFPK